MGMFPTTPGFSDSDNSELRIQQELEQAQLQQASIQMQLRAKMPKPPKGPSTFRRVLGAVTGVGASLVNPALGTAIGNMIMGSNRPAAGNFGGMYGAGYPGGVGGLYGAGYPGGTDGRDESNNARSMADSTLARWSDKAQSYLELQEQIAQRSEMLQATSGVMKAKHEAAMAAIQNIKD